VGSFVAHKKEKKGKPPAVFSGFLRPLQKKKLPAFVFRMYVYMCGLHHPILLEDAPARCALLCEVKNGRTRRPVAEYITSRLTVCFPPYWTCPARSRHAASLSCSCCWLSCAPFGWIFIDIFALRASARESVKRRRRRIQRKYSPRCLTPFLRRWFSRSITLLQLRL
jgi:hypothetical protein